MFMNKPSLILRCFVLFLAVLTGTSSVYALENGDILVADEGGLGRIFVVNPTTGARTVLSDFSNPAQGPLGITGPWGIVVDGTGNILVTDWGGGSPGGLFVVDPDNGNRTLLSDFGNIAQGPLCQDPIGIAIDGAGNLLVIDYSSGTGSNGALFVVNPTNGNRTILSDFGNIAQGPLATDTYSVAIAANGDILVLDLSYGISSRGALFSVNPANGNRTVLSDFNNIAQGPLGDLPFWVTVDETGNIYVVDPQVGTGSLGALFLIDPATGNRTLLSDFGNIAQGPTGRDAQAVTLDLNGNILVIDPTGGTGGEGALFLVDPATGNRTLLSDFGNIIQGPLGNQTYGVVVYDQAAIPTLNEWGMIIFTLLAGIGSVYFLRRKTGSNN